ncbi:unnamed protein product [Adineta steineri]|uniref:Peptidase S1 domain-containing protein n=1 Tax=Adineta steineri TaxID=433720 RepID=A0A815C0Q4_9BILA|nr:unnamed protein product [Adineta steineri]CAF1561350.1 unnamed protein product [Adineta steineri]
MRNLIVFILLLICHTYFGQETGRILNGVAAPENAYPWMVSVRFHDPSPPNRMLTVCGGSIISDIFVLTAASCFFNAHTFPHIFTIKAGAHKIDNENDELAQARTISHIITHPNYNNSNYLNDLALVRVTPPFNLKAINVNTISLSNLTSVENMFLLTIGWGVIHQTNQSVAATTLQEIVIQEDVECTNTKMTNSTTQLCAPGTCTRDSGGPLMTFSNDTQDYELVGVTSFRSSCTTEGLFTRVAPFLDWISGILENPPPTPPIVTTTIQTTTTTGRPITFPCNISRSCGCSSVPVVFHDEPSSSIKHQQRIVGGEAAQPHSWPWTVSIQAFIGHNCGGALINSEWVLSAAHCPLHSISTVHIGLHNISSLAPIIRNVSKVVVHPDFVPPPQHINDIALLRLSSPVDFAAAGEYAGISCLPTQSNDLNYPKPGTRLAVVGWGRLVYNGAAAKELQQVRVMTIDNDDQRCNNSIYDKQRQFCALVDGGGKDACQGDSGGPIHQWLDDHWEQVGIVSYGTGCAVATNPGIYTRLSYYHDWIQKTINEIDTTTIAPSTSASTTTTTVSSTTTSTITTTVLSTSTSTTTTTTVSSTSTSTTTATVSSTSTLQTTTSNAIKINSKVLFILIIFILLHFFLI